MLLCLYVYLKDVRLLPCKRNRTECLGPVGRGGVRLEHAFPLSSCPRSTFHHVSFRASAISPFEKARIRVRHGTPGRLRSSNFCRLRPFPFRINQTLQTAPDASLRAAKQVASVVSLQLTKAFNVNIYRVDNSSIRPEIDHRSEVKVKTEEIDIPCDSSDVPGIKQEETPTFDCERRSASFQGEPKKPSKHVRPSARVRGEAQKPLGRRPKVEVEGAPLAGPPSEGRPPRGQVVDGEAVLDPCEVLCKVEMNEGSAEGERNVNLSFGGVECKICRQTYSNKLNLKKHVYNVHRMVRVKCHVCDKEVNKKSLDRHMKSVHSAKVEFKKERKLVPDEEKIPCVLCEKKCLNAISLQNHVRNVHEAEQFKCSRCDFRGIRRLLEKHLKKDHSDEVHQCPRCQKILKSKSTLKEHMLIHTDDRRFICDICGLRFKRTSNYHGHLKSHQEKKFQCQLCGNFFLRKRYLAVHEQTIHNYYGEGVPPQEKGYQCEVCGVKLKWKNNLLAHMRIHTGEKPYKCKICGEDFTCHGSLRTHVTKHGGSEEFGKAEGRLDPLEAAALAHVLDGASLQLFIVDAAACTSPSRSNAAARKKVADVIEATREELMEKGSFEVLQRRAREEAEAGKAAEFLSKSFLQNQSGIEDLKSKLRGQEAARLKDMNEKQETIAALKDAIHEEIIKTDVKLRHVDRWEAAAQGQSRMRSRAAELELETKLQDTTKKLEAELRVHHEICNFLALEEKVISEELERWKETYETEMRRRKEKIKRLEIKRKEQQIMRDGLVKTYEGRQREIDAYLDLKEKLRRERERERFISEMATKIQAWWRGTMVRRGLGAFKKKKKLPKEKKKRTGGPAGQAPSA